MLLVVLLSEQQGSNWILIEPGAACEPVLESYKVGYQARYRPMSLGCVVFEQEDIGEYQWRTDCASIRLVRPRR